MIANFDLWIRKSSYTNYNVKFVAMCYEIQSSFPPTLVCHEIQHFSRLVELVRDVFFDGIPLENSKLPSLLMEMHPC
jgi:hypothetical protein